MLQPESSNCPICEEPVGNVKNHVRMSSDGAHGPQGQYPDGFTESDGATPPSTQTPRTPGGPDLSDSRLELRLEDDDDQEAGDVAGDGEDLPAVEFGDSLADASEYECAECGAGLAYHQDECECGEEPMWRAPVVEA